MSHDVIVIGGGVMGLSTAAELCSRGQKVLLFEQFARRHNLGSSHGESRVTRTAYFEHPSYVPLAQRSWMAWERLGEINGKSLLLKTGGLYLGRPESRLISGSIEAANLNGLSYELLDPQDVRNRYPQISMPEGYVGFFESQCGVLGAADCLDSLEAHAKESDFRTEEAVSFWRASNEGVSVTTQRGTYEAASLVICAGPWAMQILGALAIPLTVTRQVVGFTLPAEPALFRSTALPIVCFEAPEGPFYYTIPIWRGEHFKAACHSLGATVTPEFVDREPKANDADSFVPVLSRFLPGAGPVKRMEVCLYTNTPDGHFVVDKHPEHTNVSFACGFSGHGFKFAPVIGEALADLATSGQTGLPIGFLGLGRFLSTA